MWWDCWSCSNERVALVTKRVYLRASRRVRRRGSARPECGQPDSLQDRNRLAQVAPPDCDPGQRPSVLEHEHGGAALGNGTLKLAQTKLARLAARTIPHIERRGTRECPGDHVEHLPDVLAVVDAMSVGYKLAAGEVRGDGQLNVLPEDAFLKLLSLRLPCHGAGQA